MITKWRHSRSVLSGNPDSKELDARLRTSGMTARRCANIYCLIVSSLFIHIIVLFFLLTLPVYIKGNEKQSLWTNFIYLMWAEEVRAKSSPKINVQKKQAAAPKSMKPGEIYGDKNGNGYKTEKSASADNAVKAREDVDVSGEGISNQSFPESIKDEIEVVAKAMDGASASAEFLVLDPGPVNERFEENPPEIVRQASASEKTGADENKPIDYDYVQDGVSGTNPDSPDEVTAPVVFPSLTGALLTPDVGIGGTETDARDERLPEIKENIVSEIKELVAKDNVLMPQSPSLGLPLDASLFLKDIKIEALVRKDSGVSVYLLKNPYSSLRKRHTWEKAKKVGLGEENDISTDTAKEKKKIFTVAKADEGIYTFVMENSSPSIYNTGVVFVFYGGRKKERRKEFKSVSVPPFSAVRFMFVLPEAVFWDDEDFFTGSIEDSDSMTKFNDATGFAWREEKEF